MNAPFSAPAQERTPGLTPASSTEERRRTPWLAIAGAIAVAALLLLVLAVFVRVALRYSDFGLARAYGFVPFLSTEGVAVLGLVGLGVALVIAIIGWRSGSRARAGAGGASASEGPSHRAGMLWAAGGLAVGSVLLFIVVWELGLGYGVTAGLALIAAALVMAAGLIAAAILGVGAMRPGRATSLRTRAFGVIVALILVPSVCLSLLGVYAYYASWERATLLNTDQAYYRAGELAREIESVQRQRGRFSAEERARLAATIAAAYGSWAHPEGAQLATLAQLRATSTLPAWAIRQLERDGYAIGSERGPAALDGATSKPVDTVAWRVGPETVRYYVPVWTDTGSFTAPTPGGPLIALALSGIALIVVLGLLGAWILSRSVVRPVRRLAEASGRLAEGEAGVTVKPEGPRELRDLAVSFNDMNSKLTKAQETEQAFLLSVSHELKTPLTSIRGYAEGIGDGTVQPDDGAAVIGAESSRLERLVGDLLESGRMRKSAFTVRREAVDLAAVAADVARRCEATARDAGLTLLVNTDAGGAAGADHDRVLQVVSNLVENAIRCTPAPGTVTITTAPGVVTVADTGHGLTSDDLPRAFERFYLYTRYGTDRPVGTGLGLAIVKELTEAMGGTVSVASAVGVGTAFTVTLPGDRGAASPAAGTTAATAAPSSITAATETASPDPAAVVTVSPDAGAPAATETTAATAAPKDDVS